MPQVIEHSKGRYIYVDIIPSSRKLDKPEKDYFGDITTMIVWSKGGNWIRRPV